MDGVDDILAQWTRERPDLDVLPMGLIGRVLRVSRHLMREMETTLAEHGLNFATFDVVATLRRTGAPYSLSPGELIAAMMVSSGTMTNRLDQLEARGLICRSANPEDGRGAIVTLTAKGLALADAAVTAHVATQARLTAGLSSAEWTDLDGGVRAFLRTLEAPAGSFGEPPVPAEALRSDGARGRRPGVLRRA